MAQGGYSTIIRAHERWVFAIPEALKSEHAAPLLCAGLTVFSPLKRNGTGPGKTVGIVGIGGLGRKSITAWSSTYLLSPCIPNIANLASCFPDWTDNPDLAIQFAKALGARVIVFSHSPSKKQDSLDLGADEFVVSGEKDFAKPYFDKLDYILSAADVESIPLGDFVSMLKIDGKLTSVGLPDGEWTGLQPQMMASNASCIGTSHIGSKVEW